jgi:hypothetical protein
MAAISSVVSNLFNRELGADGLEELFLNLRRTHTPVSSHNLHEVSNAFRRRRADQDRIDGDAATGYRFRNAAGDGDFARSWSFRNAPFLRGICWPDSLGDENYATPLFFEHSGK